MNTVKYEYKVIDMTWDWSSNIERDLNNLGEKGWNLISVTKTDKYIFSRIKDDKDNLKDSF